MRLLEDVYSKAIEIKSFKYEDIYLILKPLKDLDGTFNTKNYRGSSYSAATLVYNVLLDKIRL